MPIRRAQVADAQGIVSCINEMWQYLRNRNALDGMTKNWTLRTLQGFAAAGYEAFVYANSNAGGRIDAVCIFGIENHDRNGVGPQPWMAIKVLAVRAQTVADTDNVHEQLALRAIKLAIPDAVSRFNCVGVVCQFAAGWTRLHNFLDTWTGSTNVTEISPDGQTERRWLHVNPGLPQFNARTASVGG